jgi:DNA mismatch repair protein MutL
MRADTPTDSFSTSGRVNRLPDDLVDQIAAGEVVERPASVVKELVENALDADARRIRIELREGGTALIAVTDDGIGMSARDARLALERHATSKIAVLADLQRIGSFGFRGEALPAIASVSRLRLQSRERGATSGHEIRVEAGHVSMERAAGCPEGTRIEVADLFACVPARRKFLKKAGTEWSHAIEWLGRLAMALPGVHFEILRDDREAAHWPATVDPAQRIRDVLGRDQTEGLIAVEWAEPVGQIDAWVSPPDRTRANAAGVHLWVNGRPVRDRLLRHAVLESYRDWLPRGRFPTAIVFLTVDPASVDVNVHPAKWEVRFGDPQAIHRLVRHALREAMSGRTYLDPRRASVGFARDDLQAGSKQSISEATRAGEGASSSRGDWLFAARSSVARAQGSTARANETSDFVAEGPTSAERPLRLSEMRLVGQMLASYLVVESDEGMILIDQHAAHERVLYERLRGSWLERGVERQGLLIPIDVALDPLSAEALSEAGETASRLGFEIDRFGEASVVVRAIPALLSGRDPAALVRDLAEEFARGNGLAEPDVSSTRLIAAVDRVFATLACHSARRFGDLLPVEEQRSILRDLDTIPYAPTCPHGRPVATRLARSEIEARFGRH